VTYCESLPQDRSHGGDFYPANLTETIIDIYPPPVASSPLDEAGALR
jgi:hypothetical protein